MTFQVGVDLTTFHSALISTSSLPLSSSFSGQFSLRAQNINILSVVAALELRHCKLPLNLEKSSTMMSDAENLLSLRYSDSSLGEMITKQSCVNGVTHLPISTETVPPKSSETTSLINYSIVNETRLQSDVTTTKVRSADTSLEGELFVQTEIQNTENFPKKSSRKRGRSILSGSRDHNGRFVAKSSSRKNCGQSTPNLGITKEEGCGKRIKAADQNIYEVSRIVSHRIAEDGRMWFRLRWKGYSSSDDSWEPVSCIAIGMNVLLRRYVKTLSPDHSDMDILVSLLNVGTAGGKQR